MELEDMYRPYFLVKIRKIVYATEVLLILPLIAISMRISPRPLLVTLDVLFYYLFVLSLAMFITTTVFKVLDLMVVARKPVKYMLTVKRAKWSSAIAGINLAIIVLVLYFPSVTSTVPVQGEYMFYPSDPTHLLVFDEVRLENVTVYINEFPVGEGLWVPSKDTLYTARGNGTMNISYTLSPLVKNLVFIASLYFALSVGSATFFRIQARKYKLTL